jgi:hypothetical protein
MSEELREFVQRLISELDKIVDDKEDLWITYDICKNDLDMSFFVKHRKRRSLYFGGKLETVFVKIVYEKVEGHNCDVLNMIITVKDNLGITQLNMHVNEIALFVRSLIEM